MATIYRNETVSTSVQMCYGLINSLYDLIMCRSQSCVNVYLIFCSFNTGDVIETLNLSYKLIKNCNNKNNKWQVMSREADGKYSKKNKSNIERGNIRFQV